jgi:O-antigen/teichoic acid export membrane protein
MIVRNALVNLVGQLTPLAAALVFTPPLTARLDAGQFGFLALAWVLIGYFSLFDLGFGRSLLMLLAQHRGSADEALLRRLSSTALTITLALGVLAGLALFLLADFICRSVLRLPPAIEPEAATALKVLACTIPLVTVTAVLRGLLEAGQRFGWVNALRIPMGILLFAAPLVATTRSTSLIDLAASLAAVRALAFVAHWIVCSRFYPMLTTIAAPHASAVRQLVGYGAWVTVSNLVGPLLLYVDRFAVGALVSVAAVAFYAVPLEVVTRLWIIPAALAGVLFPVIASAPDAQQARLQRLGMKVILIAIFPAALAIVVFAPQWLWLWLGPEYSLHGTRIAQFLAIGVTVNCLAYVPATIIQARGRADLMAKMHLAQVPVFLALLATLVRLHGAEGAAIATALRCVMDAAMVFMVCGRMVPGAQPRLRPGQIATVVLALAALGGGMMDMDLWWKLWYFLAVMATFAGLAWYVLLDPSERNRARDPLALLMART